MASLGARIPAPLASTISMTNAWKDILAPTHKNGLVPPSKKFPTKIPHIGKWLRNRYMEKLSRTPMSYTTKVPLYANFEHSLLTVSSTSACSILSIKMFWRGSWGLIKSGCTAHLKDVRGPFGPLKQHPHIQFFKKGRFRQMKIR